MLVLTRRQSETIQIGENIFITVVRIGPGAVRLGISAPSDINIVRPELLRDTKPPTRLQEGSDND